jgi:hypothetical protein
MGSSTFSLIRTGTIPFDSGVDPTALPKHLAASLQQARATTVDIQGNCVAFTAGVFRFVSNWNVLVPFGSGDLTVEPDFRQVRYRVSIRQLVLIGTALVGLMTVFMLMSPGWQPLVFVPFMWLWLVGANIKLGIVRFRRFVVRAIATAPNLRPQSAALG